MADALELPEDLLKVVRNRSNRQEHSRFPYKLWRLLNWVTDDAHRFQVAGCGWVSDSEFFIEKSVLCKTMNIEPNTLNVNLRHLGFQQSRSHEGVRTFWSNEGFSRNAQPEDFERIRNSRCRPEALQKLDIRAVFLPILEPLQIWGGNPVETNQFKREVVMEWHRLVGKKLIFALAATDFFTILHADLDEIHGRQAPDRLLLQHALTIRQREVCDVFDFALLLDRFGPYRTVPEKLNQYQQLLNEMKPDFYAYGWPAPAFGSYFSATFHNCFRFPLTPTGEYHCYNLPWMDTGAQFLTDEDGTLFQSWQWMMHQNKSFIVPQPR
jgi:hypothetical protein